MACISYKRKSFSVTKKIYFNGYILSLLKNLLWENGNLSGGPLQLTL